MNIYFCNQCGKRVLQADVEAGSARASGETRALCPECNVSRRSSKSAKSIPAMRSTGRLTRMSSTKMAPARRTTAALAAAASGTEVLTAPSARRGPGATPPATSSQQKTLVFAGTAIAVACLIVVVVVSTGSGAPSGKSGEKTGKSSTTTTASTAFTLPPELPGQTTSGSKTDDYDPRAWTANSMLAAAKTFFKEHPDDAWGYREKLQAVADQYAGTPAADEAQKILADLVIRRDDRLAKDDAWANAVDLFKITAPERDTLQGKCEFRNGVLKTELSGNWFRLRVPYAPPDEYDVKLRFKRLQGDECLVLGLSNQGNPFCFMAAGWKNTKAGFENIKGQRVPGGPFTLDRPPILITGTEYELIVQVRRNSLRAFLNGQHLVSAEVFSDDLSESPSWKFPYTGETGLGLGHIGPYEFYEMRLRPVSGQGKPIDASTLAAANTSPPDKPKPDEKKPQAPPPKPDPKPDPKPAAKPMKEDVVLELSFQYGSALGWEAKKGLEPFSFADGALVTRTTDSDAYMELGNMKIDTAMVTHVTFQMRSDKPGGTQVYYATSGSPAFAKNEVLTAPCTGDGKWHDYAVKLADRKNFGGELRALRLDPVNGNEGVGAKIELRWIRLVKRTP